MQNKITNILLVEDNPGDAKLVEVLLTDMGEEQYRLTIADCMSEAMDLISREEFSVAILDMSLPDREGLDCISDIKSFRPELPIVVLSGRQDEEFALQTVKAGAQDYLTKGVDDWHLIRALYYAIERKRLHDNVVYMAQHDQLTGLANRTLFRSRLEHAIHCAKRREDSVALLYLDLDHFKPINDGLGHEMGDKVLIEIAKRLSHAIREVDTIARLGGDEFAIILEGVVNTNSAIAVSEKVISTITTPLEIDSHILYVGVSIGIAIYPHCGKDVETIVKNADSAMYKAKHNGRNQYQFYTKEMNHRALDELTMEMQLREALDKEEFLLHYQPKLDVQSGKLTGNEALLRWKHPEQGLIYPTRFIPLLEKSGMISEVGRWVLETACKQHVSWSKQGVPVGKIAVNLSGQQLLQRNFSDTVCNILNETELDPHLLEVELTESLLIQNSTATMKILEALKSMGVSIAIDDFGTGYNSFNYLKRFLVDTLKIDRSFIQNVTETGPESYITSAMIHMAKDLGINVIAEGVEKKEQLDFLREQDVDEIQGFYLSPPVSSNDYTDLVIKLSEVA